MADAPLITFVLCSRNDQFQGDSLWRLSTTLNYLARQLAALGRLDQAEVIVTDWGSREPLRDAIPLTAQARSLVRFLTIPEQLAAEKQQDSPFGEVIAINAAVRRARGEYIGRIDQDTLVGRRFLEWFFDAAQRPSEPDGIDGLAMVANRRRIPYHFAVATPRFALVERYVEKWGGRGLLPEMIRPAKGRYWQCYIGILLLHRTLWEECEGYDESFLYYGYMEFDLFLRLLTKYKGMDLGPVVGCDFFHLDHVPAWRVRVKQARRENPIRTVEQPPTEMRPNGPGWGLADEDLRLEPSASTAVLSDADTTWSDGDRAALRRLTATSTVRTVGQITSDYAAAALDRLPRWSRQAIDTVAARVRLRNG